MEVFYYTVNKYTMDDSLAAALVQELKVMNKILGQIAFSLSSISVKVGK